MRHASLVSLAVMGALFGFVRSSLAQAQAFGGCSPVDQGTVTGISKNFIDDFLPNSDPAQSRIQLSAMRGLGVKAADFDRNGYLDLVIGGQEHPNVALSEKGWVKIFYFGVTSPGQGVSLIHTENVDALAIPPYKHVANCYGVDVGDFNKDGWPDICVGRRDDDLGPLLQLYDCVFLNNQSTATNSDHFPIGTTVGGVLTPVQLIINGSLEPWIPYLPIPPANGGIRSETYAIDVASVDDSSSSSRNLDIVTCGYYGIRLFHGNGNGTFTHTQSYIDGPTTQPSPGVYRNITFGDVDGNGTLDMVITRDGSSTPGPTASDRVWFNQFPGPANPQFALTPPGSTTVPAALQKPPILAYQWRTVAGSSLGVQSGACPVGGYDRSIDSALGDVDGDGDLDLSIAHANARNVLYLNDGQGIFGSANSGACAGNGLYTFSFKTPTSDWPNGLPTSYGTSEMLFDSCKSDLAAVLGVPAASLVWTDFEFHLDGKIVDTTSSTRIADLDNDGLGDVIFCNRTEGEEVAKYAYQLINPNRTTPYPYYSTTLPAPDVYDHIYSRINYQGGMYFAQCVELVGFANDGTSYVELVPFGSSRALDWIESNYNNIEYHDESGVTQFGTPPAWNTWVFFGLSQTGTSFPGLCKYIGP